MGLVSEMFKKLLQIKSKNDKPINLKQTKTSYILNKLDFVMPDLTLPGITSLIYFRHSQKTFTILLFQD